MTTVATAAVAQVQAAVPDVTVYDALPTELPPARYVVATPNSGLRSRDTYDGEPDSAVHRMSVMCVAPTRVMAEVLQQEITNYLLANRVTADGWYCSKWEHVNSREPVPDESVTERPVIYGIDEYRLQADKR